LVGCAGSQGMPEAREPSLCPIVPVRVYICALAAFGAFYASRAEICMYFLIALQSLAPRGSLADYLGHVTSALIMRPRCMALHRSKKTHGFISVLKTN
jgi:hypothetical protein